MKKQADGRYRQKITVGHDADGRAVVKYISARTKKDLQAQADEVRRSYIGGEKIDRNVMAVPYIEQWLKIYKAPHVEPSTWVNYEAAMKRIRPALEGKRLSAITDNDLQQLLNDLSGTNRTLVTDVKSILQNVFTKAHARGIIDINPAGALTKPDIGQETRRALTPAESAALLKVAESHPRGLLLCLLYYTGMRRGEALGLRWSDIDFSADAIHIERDIDYVINAPGSVKSDYSIRTVPMPEPLRAALRAEPVKSMDYVIRGARGGWMPQSSYVRTWRSLMAALYEADKSIEHADLTAGIKNAAPLVGSVLTAHYLRHNYASLLYNAGVDVLTAQRYLGHSDPATTLRIYTHLSTAKQDVDKARVLEVLK